MRRTPLELAAIATAAVPGLAPTATAFSPDDDADFDSALLLDADGKRWRVRSPRHPEASTRLETEFMVLRAFAPSIRAELPFHVPTIAGTVRQGDLTTFVYTHLHGAMLSIDELSAGSPALAREIGSALAAIHDLPLTLVTNADLPSYSANEFRQRKLNELDQAATTGKIPATLLRRWEHALEDVALWRFSTSVVHGDLHEDNLMVQDDSVTALTGWTDLRIGDPADDFAWLVASNEASFVEAVLNHYTQARREKPDVHLLRRAALLAEFALAQYLVKAMAAGHQSMTAEAESMLQTLSADIDEQARRDEEAAQAAENEAAEILAADAQAAATSAGQNPPVSVVAIPNAEPTVTVAAIPGTSATSPERSLESAQAGTTAPGSTADAEETEKPVQAGAGDSNGTNDPDDTSTAAISVVKVTPLHTANRS
ncbi:macrolide 2'-phosphotransferase [Paenarthrobacter sp. OM7]|uniref:macrolide 2'-phosphotransferase n=1 Tax=Paenarthrobacter sp. OM7 TaxID=3041264 RepID=UPI00246886F8|nr:macrolide 2'-phosphotransferase [Paenarthrobacter sp. OM7]WGM19125.1 macrolide 2'-phosphotransferase [Paenarthrobacter sp. OM7]